MADATKTISGTRVGRDMQRMLLKAADKRRARRFVMKLGHGVVAAVFTVGARNPV